MNAFHMDRREIKALLRPREGIPAKKPIPNPNAIAGSPDQSAAGFWQDGNQIYSKNQVCKAVAIVLSGYDSQTAALSVDPNLDPCTVDIWIQLYRPTFFEDGMACPPALIMWWMDEMDRKQNLGQVPLQQSQSGGQQPWLGAQGQQTLIGGQLNPGVTNNPAPNQNSGLFGTSYMKVPYVTADGTVVSQTVTNPRSGGAGNSIVISSPSASQPNIRVVYQDQTLPQQTQSLPQPQPQRPYSSPSQISGVTYDMLGSPFQQQLTAIQNQKQAEDALAALQAQTAAIQAQTASLQAQTGQRGLVQGQKGGRVGGPPYSRM